MKRTLLAAAAAIATTAVIAAPLFAQPANNSETGNTEPLSGPPAASASQAMPGQMGMGVHHHASMPWGMAQGRMGWVQHRMARMQRSPQTWCLERLARRAGMRAYIGAKLNLTSEQRPLWNKLQATAHKEAQQERQLCNSIKPGISPTVMDRLQRMQRFLTIRLDGLKAAMPEVEKLYAALSPQQREVLNHPFQRD